MTEVFKAVSLCLGAVVVGSFAMLPSPPPDLAPPVPLQSVNIHFPEHVSGTHLLQAIQDGHDIHVWMTGAVPMGDFDEDGDVDLIDWGCMQDCYGTNAPGYPFGDPSVLPACSGWPCARVDFDHDGLIHDYDAVEFARASVRFPDNASNPGVCP